ncbi:bacteriohemerythrin [candidate division KSB1 bacterium]
MALEWSEKYSVGVEWIDAQHKELLKQVSRLTDAITENRGAEIIGSVIAFLDAYCKKHLRNEEKIMAMHKYPDLMNHKSQHTSFSYNLSEIKKRIDSGNASDTVISSLQRLVIDWWINHINRTDKLLGKFLINSNNKSVDS